jgi:REP element-mobilizing transposase RayT
MPDHLHTLLVQNNEVQSVSDLVRLFKTLTSRRHRPVDYPHFASLWRDEFDDVPVPGDIAAKTKLDYMLNNPIRSGLCSKPEDYLWSSARHVFYGTKDIVTVLPMVAESKTEF